MNHTRFTSLFAFSLGSAPKDEGLKLHNTLGPLRNISATAHKAGEVSVGGIEPPTIGFKIHCSTS